MENILKMGYAIVVKYKNGDKFIVSFEVSISCSDFILTR